MLTTGVARYCGAGVSPARVLPIIGLLFLSAAARPASGQDTASVPTDATLCQLVIQGSAIQRLELLEKTGRVVEIDQPAGVVSLPAGEYRIREVRLRGGYYGRASSARDRWFKLTPDQPTELDVGAPLQLRVSTGRRGRSVTMDYKLTDAAGCRYYDGEARALPKFTVFQNGQEIGSGSFEYG